MIHLAEMRSDESFISSDRMKLNIDFANSMS
jgi:hypothetical protein